MGFKWTSFQCTLKTNKNQTGQPSISLDPQNLFHSPWNANPSTTAEEDWNANWPLPSPHAHTLKESNHYVCVVFLYRVLNAPALLSNYCVRLNENNPLTFLMPCVLPTCVYVTCTMWTKVEFGLHSLFPVKGILNASTYQDILKNSMFTT